MNDPFSITWADTPYCVGCRYYRVITQHGHAPGKVCHYLLDTGHRRGCPFGEGCTRWEADEKRKPLLPK